LEFDGGLAFARVGDAAAQEFPVIREDVDSSPLTIPLPPLTYGSSQCGEPIQLLAIGVTVMLATYE